MVKQLLYDSLHSPENQVVAQLINGREVEADSVVMMPRGSGVTLRVSYTIDRCDTLVPSLVGYSLMEAERCLWETGLNVGDIRYDGSVDMRDRRASRVFLQGIGPNKRVAFGSEVSLYLTNETTIVDSMRVVASNESRINALVRVARERILDVKRGIEMGIMNSRPADYYDSDSTTEIIEIDDEDDFFLY
jgi:beta-lactam-binding protein with PASTA domain